MYDRKHQLISCFLHIFSCCFVNFSWCQHLNKAVEEKTQSGNLLKMHQEPVSATPDSTITNDEASEEPEIESKEYVTIFLKFIVLYIFLFYCFILFFIFIAIDKEKCIFVIYCRSAMHALLQIQ